MGWLPLGPLAVYIFFAISGYLISISWSRDSNISRFIFKRALRIFPGLVVCIFLTIFVLGAYTTSLSLPQYLSSPVTLAYAKNILLNINYTLPGVFETTTYARAVNGSIWSLPVEFSMYLIFAVVSAVCRVRWLHRAVIISLAHVFFITYYFVGIPDVVFYSLPIKYIAICGLYFLVGVVIQQWSLLRFSSVTSTVILIIIWLSLSRWPIFFEYASYLILPYIVISFGASSSIMLAHLDGFDYSYGIYIYAFPVQQVINMYFVSRGHLFGFLVSALITTILAGMSWHLVEKPALRHKNLIRV